MIFFAEKNRAVDILQVYKAAKIYKRHSLPVNAMPRTCVASAYLPARYLRTVFIDKRWRRVLADIRFLQTIDGYSHFGDVCGLARF